MNSEIKTLGQAADSIKRLRGDILFNDSFDILDREDDIVCCHFLKSLALLEQAYYEMQMAILTENKKRN